MTDVLEHLIEKCKTFYLPNYYGGKIKSNHKIPFSGDVLNIGCFGALRPMKNQLIQAVAAILFADLENKQLRFHINSRREEMGGNSVVKNLRYLFQNSDKHNLVEHPWATHKEFIKVMREMDLSMQVSYSETFNIVSSDAVSNHIPVVVSSEISWLPKSLYADPNSTEDIVEKMIRCSANIHKHGEQMVNENLEHLEKYNDQAISEWKKFVHEISEK